MEDMCVSVWLWWGGVWCFGGAQFHGERGGGSGTSLSMWYLSSVLLCWKGVGGMARHRMAQECSQVENVQGDCVLEDRVGGVGFSPCPECEGVCGCVGACEVLMPSGGMCVRVCGGMCVRVCVCVQVCGSRSRVEEGLVCLCLWTLSSASCFWM